MNAFYFHFRENEVEQQLKLCPVLCPSTNEDRKEIIKNIKEVLDLKNRPYLSMFQLGRDISLTNTIFRAVFDRKNIQETCIGLSNLDIIF
jgi:hypothetical protein